MTGVAYRYKRWDGVMISQKIGKIINTCNDTVFSARSGEVWTVDAECTHGKFTAKSSGPADIESAFIKLVKDIRAAHGLKSDSDVFDSQRG